jgi:hypothetical protein
MLDFNAKEERENVFKLTVGDENFDESSNDNGICVVSFATSKNLVGRQRLIKSINMGRIATGQMFEIDSKLSIIYSIKLILHRACDGLSKT